MKVISKAQQAVLKILGNPQKSASGYRLIKYCVQENVEDGVLLFNVLTREVLLLTRDEFENYTENKELLDKWFLVPEDFDEKATTETVRWVLRNTAEKPKHITTYTIMTTTDCNARCFYCFEKGCARIPMSEETAHKTAQYIKEHCGGKRVKLAWFGGEPLLNMQVMDIICEDLKNAGIEYYSGMTSNGYLFCEDDVSKAKTLWNLKHVQITLDGTEKVYNRSKAYIYKDGKSPYQVVLNGIELLLDAGVQVAIRLNLDLYNADDLMNLVDEIAERFSGKKGLVMYAHHLFDTDLSMAQTHTDEEWEPRYEAMYRLNSKIDGYGIGWTRGIKKTLKLMHCMADGGSARVIAPKGDIGLCEHYTDCEFIGHIDREDIDKAMVESWKELSPEIPECNDCFYYPGCVKLKKCTANSTCYRHEREANLREIKRSMLHEYKLWQQNAQKADDEDEEIC